MAGKDETETITLLATPEDNPTAPGFQQPTRQHPLEDEIYEH